MIELTRFNGSPLFVNPDLIKWAEAAPDTMLTLINGEKVVVHEPCGEVIRRIDARRIEILAAVARLAPSGCPSLYALPAILPAEASLYQPESLAAAGREDLSAGN